MENRNVIVKKIKGILQLEKYLNEVFEQGNTIVLPLNNDLNTIDRNEEYYTVILTLYK